MPRCPLCGAACEDILERFTVSDLLCVVPKVYRTCLRRELELVDAFEVYQCRTCRLIFYFPAVQPSEQFYALVSQRESYYLKEKPEYDLVRPHLPVPLRLLEVGCGKGYFSRVVQEHLDRYHGLEFNTEAVLYAQHHGLSVTSEPIEAFAVSHPAEFNAVGSFQVLEHIADIHSFVDASLACLEKGGVFFFAVPNQDSFVGSAPNAMTNLPPHHASRWSRSTVEQLGKVFPLDLITVIEEKLAEFHIMYYAETCYKIGLLKMRGWPNSFVSSRIGKRGLITKAYERFFLYPILNAIAVGMRDFPPQPQGHTILGIYRKR